MDHLLAVMVALLSVISTAAGQTHPMAKAASPPTVDLAALVAQKKVAVEADGKAIHTLIVRLRKAVPGSLLVRIPAGAYWVSRDAKSQNLVTVKSQAVALGDGNWKTVELDVACANRERRLPGANDRYDPGPDVAQLSELAQQLEKLDSFAARQAAVWIVTDTASEPQLGSLSLGMMYGPRAITSYDMVKAMKAVADAGIDIRSREIWNDRGAILAGFAPEIEHRGNAGLNSNEVSAAQHLRDWLLPDYKKDVPLDLNSRSASRRANAVRAYLEYGFPDAFEHIVPLLRDTASGPRIAAAQTLGALGDPRSVEPLMRYLEDARADRYAPQERSAGARALGKLKDPRGIPALIKILQSGTDGTPWNDSAGVASAAWALGEIGDPSAVPALLRVASMPNYAMYDEVRSGIPKALVKLGAIDEMLKLVSDKPAGHTEALGMCRDARCEDLLIGLLQGPDTAKKAAEALSHSGTTRSVVPLIRALSLPAGRYPPGTPYLEERQNSVVDALKHITGKDFGTSPARWNLWLKSRGT